MNDSEAPREPDRIFQRRATYDFRSKEMGFASLSEFHNYIDRGAELISQIMEEAGNASELTLKYNLFTEPEDKNAAEDLLEIEKSEYGLTVRVVNPKKNDFWLTAHFRIMNEEQ